MTTVIKIDDESVSAEDFVKYLKLTNEFPDLIDKLIRAKVTVQAAKKQGIQVTSEEVQQSADDFRRYVELNRAKDTQEWMDEMGVNLDDFENFITEQIFKRKVLEKLTTDEAIQEYFKLNSPKFDKADIKRIVVEGQGKAKELCAMLEDDPESFDEMVKEHSLDDETKATGGLIGNVSRGALPDEVDAKVFNAEAGDIIGPFQIEDEDLYEILQITAFRAAELDDATNVDIGEIIYNEWLAERMKDHSVAVQ
jgi:peptidylprolyl isomerase